VFFPEPVPDPEGRPCYAMLHRPMWNLGWVRPGQTEQLPAGLSDPRPGIWISYVPVDLAHADLRALGRPENHRLVALPEFAYEELKIGAGPPPIRVEEGWLLIHHGVSGDIPEGWDPTNQRVEYAAGAMLLDAGDPSRVIARTEKPILAPETADELHGLVSNVVFPTAVESVDGVSYAFYGMADAKIGVARLDRADHDHHSRSSNSRTSRSAP
jgi:predicted GH43/DUF377 family glycosyl hydrolase